MNKIIYLSYACIADRGGNIAGVKMVKFKTPY